MIEMVFVTGLHEEEKKRIDVWISDGSNPKKAHGWL